MYAHRQTEEIRVIDMIAPRRLTKMSQPARTSRRNATQRSFSPEAFVPGANSSASK